MNRLAEENSDETGASNHDALSKCETCETYFLSLVNFIHHIEKLLMLNFWKIESWKVLGGKMTTINVIIVIIDNC